MAAIHMKRLVKRYGDTEVIPSLDLEIRDQEFMVFVGPSGCGKSTLLRIVAGLEPVDGGELYIGDERVNDVPPSRRDIAMVFQDYALYPHMSVYDNMAFGLEMRRTPRAEIDRRVKRAAELLRIEQYLKRRPGALSGGQRQRVAMGRAMVRNPKVFLFDEPLSNLDAKLRTEVRTEIKALSQELKTTMIFVTHDQVEAMTMADRIVVLNKGVIQQVGTPDQVYGEPANQFVASFIGSPTMNFFDAAVDGGTLRLKGGAILPVPQRLQQVLARDGANQVVVGIRPEHLQIGPPGGEGIAIKLSVVEPLGSDTLLYFNCDNGRHVARVPPDFKAKAGDSATLGLPREKLHLFRSSDGAVLR